MAYTPVFLGAQEVIGKYNSTHLSVYIKLSYLGITLSHSNTIVAKCQRTLFQTRHTSPADSQT